MFQRATEKPAAFAIDNRMHRAARSMIDQSLANAKHRIASALPAGVRIETSTLIQHDPIVLRRIAGDETDDREVRTVEHFGAEVWSPEGWKLVSVHGAESIDDLVTKTLAAVEEIRKEQMQKAAG